MWTERYVRADAGGSGDGTADTSGSAWTIAQAMTSATAGMRVNIRGDAGTYSLTTTTLSLPAVTNVWWRGFNATVGDLDDDYVTTQPQIVFTTGHFATSAGTKHLFTSLTFSSANTNQTVLMEGTAHFFRRCRFLISTTGRAFHMFAADSTLLECYIQAPANATRALLAWGRGTVSKCYVVGGIVGIDGVCTAAGTHIRECLVDPATHGIVVTGNNGGTIVGNTVYAPTSDGIRFTVAATAGLCEGNLIVSPGAYGINATSGEPLMAFLRNAFYNPGTAETNGLGDRPLIDHITETSDPLTNGAGGDFSLVSTALSKGGAGVQFQDTTLTSHVDAGAIQRAEAGGGVVLSGANYRGNYQ